MRLFNTKYKLENVSWNFKKIATMVLGCDIKVFDIATTVLSYDIKVFDIAMTTSRL